MNETEERQIAFFYPNDDCSCSAIIAKHATPNLELQPVGIKGSCPWEKIAGAETVYLIGCSFWKEHMIQLFQKHKVVFINHRKEVVSELLEEGIPLKEGKWNADEEGDVSTCMLTWEYFFQYREVPKPIRWISDFNKWLFKFEETIPFHYALSTRNLVPQNNASPFWNRLLQQDKQLIDSLLRQGRILDEYHREMYKAIIDDLVYFTEIKGHKAVAMNVRGITSLSLKDFDFQGAEVVIMYLWLNKPGQYQITLFQAPESTVHVGAIAKSYKGGGGQGAAGFRCNELPFAEQAIDKDKTPTYEDPYQQFKDCLNRNPQAMRAYLSQMFGSSAFTTTFEGYSAIGVNDFDTSNIPSSKLDEPDAKLVISFCWVNCGQYRIIVRSPLPTEVDLEALAKKYNGKMVDGACWFYSPTLPFDLNRYLWENDRKFPIH